MYNDTQKTQGGEQMIKILCIFVLAMLLFVCTKSPYKSMDLEYFPYVCEHFYTAFNCNSDGACGGNGAHPTLIDCSKNFTLPDDANGVIRGFTGQYDAETKTYYNDNYTMHIFEETEFLNVTVNISNKLVNYTFYFDGDEPKNYSDWDCEPHNNTHDICKYNKQFWDSRMHSLEYLREINDTECKQRTNIVEMEPTIKIVDWGTIENGVKISQNKRKICPPNTTEQEIDKHIQDLVYRFECVPNVDDVLDIVCLANDEECINEMNEKNPPGYINGGPGMGGYKSTGKIYLEQIGSLSSREFVVEGENKNIKVVL